MQGLRPQGLPALLTISECAEALRLTPQSVRRQIRAGTIPAVTIGNQRSATIRVPAAALAEALEPVKLTGRSESDG